MTAAGLTDQRFQQRIRAGLLDRVELAVLQVLDPRREAESEQVTETEHMVGRAGGIAVVLANAQIGLVHMMQQVIQDVRRFAHRRGDHPRVERAVAAGDVGIDDEAGQCAAPS